MAGTKEKRDERALLADAQHYALVLRAWEAINVERDLKGILAALDEVLQPVVPFIGIAIIAPQVVQGRPYVMHLTGLTPEEREQMLKQEKRGADIGELMSLFPERKLRGYEESELHTSDIYT